jgi:hypothetical protein
MKLFRFKGKPDDPSAEKELVLDTDAEEASAAQVQPSPTAEPAPEARQEAPVDVTGDPEARPPSQESFLAEIGAEADKEMAEQERLIAGEGLQEDDALDPGLVDLFRDAKTEVEESSLAAELDNIPAREILDEITEVSQRLGVPSDGLRSRPEGGEELADGEAGRPDGEVERSEGEGGGGGLPEGEVDPREVQRVASQAEGGPPEVQRVAAQAEGEGLQPPTGDEEREDDAVGRGDGPLSDETSDGGLPDHRPPLMHTH